MHDLHRSNSAARQHYTIDRKSFTNLSPALLYSGTLSKMRDWKDAIHSHDFLEIILVLDGVGTVVVDNREYQIGQGNIIIYNAGIKHQEHNSPEMPMEVRFAAFHKIQLKNLPENCILPPKSTFVFPSGQAEKILTNLFDIMNVEIATKDEFYIEVAENAACMLLMYIFRIINQNQGSLELLNKETILQDVLNYIDTNFTKDIGLGEISSKCFVNKYYLSHLFNDHLGMTVGQYIRDKRIALAKNLLQKGAQVSEISEQCGFHDSNYFIRLFKKTTTMTPLQYRKKQHE